MIHWLVSESHYNLSGPFVSPFPPFGSGFSAKKRGAFLRPSPVSATFGGSLFYRTIAQLANLCALYVVHLAVANDIQHTVNNHFLCFLGHNNVLDTLSIYMLQRSA